MRLSLPCSRPAPHHRLQVRLGQLLADALPLLRHRPAADLSAHHLHPGRHVRGGLPVRVARHLHPRRGPRHLRLSGRVPAGVPVRPRRPPRARPPAPNPPQHEPRLRPLLARPRQPRPPADAERRVLPRPHHAQRRRVRHRARPEEGEFEMSPRRRRVAPSATHPPPSPSPAAPAGRGQAAGPAAGAAGVPARGPRPADAARALCHHVGQGVRRNARQGFAAREWLPAAPRRSPPRSPPWPRSTRPCSAW